MELFNFTQKASAVLARPWAHLSLGTVRLVKALCESQTRNVQLQLGFHELHRGLSRVSATRSPGTLMEINSNEYIILQAPKVCGQLKRKGSH